MIARQMISRQAALQLAGVRRITVAAPRFAEGKSPGPIGPTHDSRISPKSESSPSHPGYTDASTPVTGDHPGNMPGPDRNAQVAGNIPQASTRPRGPHPEVHEMAEGAKIGGEDAITPEERNVKNWGPNQRTPEFNELEGKRNPVLHGGSNEGGHDSKGDSKT